jgi:hypothetical protein
LPKKLTKNWSFLFIHAFLRRFYGQYWIFVFALISQQTLWSGSIMTEAFWGCFDIKFKGLVNNCENNISSAFQIDIVAFNSSIFSWELHTWVKQIFKNVSHSIVSVWLFYVCNK